MRLACIFLTALIVAPAPALACQQLPSVYFWRGSAAVNEDGKAVLRDFAQQMTTRFDEVQAIRIVGHSDRTGPRAARERIAQQRARAVRDILLAYGIPEPVMSVAGAGDRQLLLETEDNVPEQQNRRAEVRLVFKPNVLEARRIADSKDGRPVPMC